MNKDAKAEWRRVAKELVAAGTLAKTDLAVLASYCTAWARYKAAAELINAEGLTCVNDKGVVKRHPAVGIIDAAEKQLRLLASELGLTHLSRQRMHVAPTQEADQFEVFLRGQACQN